MKFTKSCSKNSKKKKILAIIIIIILPIIKIVKFSLEIILSLILNLMKTTIIWKDVYTKVKVKRRGKRITEN